MVVDTGNIHRNSVMLQHKDRSNFLATLLPNMVIKPHFQKDTSITWYLDGVELIKDGDNWILPEIHGTSPMDVIDKAYDIYVFNQPVIKSKRGQFQVTKYRTITYGQEPY